MMEHKLALKDLEIMRLREALEELKNTLPVRSWTRFIATNALSTPTTYDDLMAWHNEQLGEPVAYVSKDTAYYFGISDKQNSGTFRYGKFLEATEPLYVKKG